MYTTLVSSGTIARMHLRSPFGFGLRLAPLDFLFLKAIENALSSAGEIV